jgi:hypothetical protein
MVAKPILTAYADLAIYRNNGSLRMSNNMAYYNPEYPQIHLVTPEGYSKMLDIEEKSKRYDIKGAGLCDIKKKAEAYLKEKKLVWE